MKTTIITLMYLLISMIPNNQAIASAPEIKHSGITLENGDTDFPVITMIQKAVQFPKSISLSEGCDEVFLHIYISHDGRVYILEAYSANTELKNYVLKKLDRCEFAIPADQRGRNYEFTMKFRVI